MNKNNIFFKFSNQIVESCSIDYGTITVTYTIQEI